MAARERAESFPQECGPQKVTRGPIDGSTPIHVEAELCGLRSLRGWEREREKNT